MATKAKLQTVPLKNIYNDPQNPRHPELDSQVEITEWMLKEYGTEIVNLAEDIGVNGLSLIETMLVIPHSTEKGKFIAVEGNRRLLAMKLLKTPTLANSAKWEKKFSELSSKYKASVPSDIQVVIAPDRQTCDWMIDRRHSGEDAGRGLIRWNPQQKARSERRREGKALRYEQALQVIDYAMTNNLLGGDTKLLGETKFPITNLERMLADANVRHSLGIDFRDGTLVFKLQPEEVNKGLARVLGDLLETLSVSEIKNADQRREYIDGLGEDLPDTKTRLDDPIPATEVPPPKKQRPLRSKPHPHKRRHIIDSASPIRVKDKKIQRVYGELKDLEVGDFPVAAAGLIRAFLEQSMDHFITTKGLAITTKSRDGRATIRERIAAISQDLNSRNAIDKQLFKALERIRNGQAGRADPDLLHMHLHSAYQPPNKQDLIDIWDTPYGPFLTALWNDL